MASTWDNFSSVFPAALATGLSFIPQTSGMDTKSMAGLYYDPKMKQAMYGQIGNWTDLMNKTAATPALTPFQKDILGKAAQNFALGGTRQQLQVQKSMEPFFTSTPNQLRDWFGPKTDFTSGNYLAAMNNLMTKMLGGMGTAGSNPYGGGYGYGGGGSTGSTAYDDALPWQNYYVGGAEREAALKRLEEIEKMTPERAAMEIVGPFGAKLNTGTAVAAASEGIATANLNAKAAVSKLLMETADAKDLAARYAEDARLKRQSLDSQGANNSAAMALQYEQLAAEKQLKIMSLLQGTGMGLAGLESQAAQYVPQMLNVMGPTYQQTTAYSPENMAKYATLGNLGLENMGKIDAYFRDMFGAMQPKLTGQTYSQPGMSAAGNMGNLLTNPAFTSMLPGAMSGMGGLFSNVFGGSSAPSSFYTPEPFYPGGAFYDAYNAPYTDYGYVTPDIPSYEAPMFYEGFDY